VSSAPTPPDRYALVGHPVSHSWSPFIHGMFARATLQHMQYRLIDVAGDRFRAEAVQFFVDGGKGLNVTIPHKQAAVEFVNELTTRAEEAGAVNTISLTRNGELLGDNTDGIGLVLDLEQNLGLNLADKRILVLGAGGATRGVVGPLLARRPNLLAIANRTVARAVEIAEAFSARGSLVPSGFDTVEAKPFDLIINATAASLAGTVPPIAAATVGRETVCYDMAYATGDTPFTHWAAGHGARATHKGWGMLVEQAAEAFLIWRGVRPQTRQVLDLLTAKGREISRITRPGNGP
jgi:shikimate dehydrogenase